MAKWRLKNLFWISPDEDTESATDVEASEPPRPVESVLSILKDVDGVVGSIVARTDGTVLGYDLPRTFDHAAAEGAARQMSLLRTALAMEPGGLKTGVLRFRDFHFHVDEVPSGLLGVLAAEKTDRPALRMAVRLLARRLEDALNSGGSGPP